MISKNRADNRKMKENEIFEKAPVSKAYFTMALPVVLSMVVSLIYNMVDTYFIAGTGNTDLVAGVSLGAPVFTLMIALGDIFGLGGSSVISRMFGKKQDDDGRRMSVFCFYAAILCGILVIIIMLAFRMPILHMLGADEDTLCYASAYYTGIVIGAPFIILSFTPSNLLRTEGFAKASMVGTILGAVVNMVLDPVFISLLGFGAAGAAIATVTAQALSVVFAVMLLLKKDLPFAITKKDFRLNPQCRKFLKIGLPLALQEFLTQISFLALCAFVNRLGLEASSGYGVACKIVNFAMLVPSSLMQSMASFVSQNIGAGKKKRAKQSMFTGIGVGLAVGCVVFVLVLFKGDVLCSAFSTDAAVIQNGFAYLKGFAPETLVTAILFSMVGYFNGNNKTVWVMTQGLIQTLLVRLPLAYFMSIQPNASLTKIGLAAPVATTVGIVLNVGFFSYLNWAEQRRSILS